MTGTEVTNKTDKMIKGFSRRKITTQKTLGEHLQEARQKKQATLLQAEIATKVRADFLEDIEKNDWSKLPSEVYVRGFVLAYAKYLDIDKGKISEIFEAEANLKRTKSDSSPVLSYQKRIKENKFILTPRFIGYAVLCSFIITLFGYIIYQVLNFAGSPDLKVVTPDNNAITENDTADLKGVTDNNIMLTVNNEPIPVTNDGHFSTSLRLHRGINIIKVKAVNKAKKETSEVITIEYKPKTAANFGSLPQN